MSIVSSSSQSSNELSPSLFGQHALSQSAMREQLAEYRALSQEEKKAALLAGAFAGRWWQVRGK